MTTNKDIIETGKAILGIELGSTRIKAVLLGENHQTIAIGGHGWENHYEKGIWTYSLEEIWSGLQDCYQNLAENIEKEYQTKLRKVAAIGFSGMMHGYMAFDQNGDLLTPFRTWRNNSANQAAKELSSLFQYNIPERWSIAHLYQAILNGEEHVKELSYITTLSGYIHWKMTGKRMLGVGDASGMFPIDSSTKDYYSKMVASFDEKISGKYPWKLLDIMPKVMVAGEEAGRLTEEGARLLDPTGSLEAGCPVAPPEGDAGTGMVATNSVGVRTGNVSAGTSIFGMFVLEHNLKKFHPEIDMVTTPAGHTVAMVHANNCTSDIDAWVRLFEEFAQAVGSSVDKNTLYRTLFQKALEGDVNCGGLLSYAYISGEFITACEAGRPLFVRKPDSKMNLANFMRAQLYSALATLKIGMDILKHEEDVRIDSIFGHGGYFKTPGVGQKFLAAAVEAPVSVMDSAGEGGPWGMAILTAFMLEREEGEELQDFLSKKIYADSHVNTILPDSKEVEGFKSFMESFKAGLEIERLAGKL